MKEYFYSLLIILSFVVISVNAQDQVCDPSLVTGPNLVVNGDFEDGDSGFYTDLACSWNDPSTCGCHSEGYSRPNQYYIGNRPNEVSVCGDVFQNGFMGSPHGGAKFMMIDGIGSSAAVIWGQSVQVEPGTYYYFEVWISTIGADPATRAKLKFSIDGVEQPATIDAPYNVSQWVRYHQLWYSGTNSGNIEIQIKDIQPESAGPDQDDFAIDDVAFKKGCPPDTYVEKPELGPDLTFCGTDQTSFTLDPNVTPGPGQNLTWSTGSADADKNTIDVSTAGKYYVCLNQAGSCTKIDSIRVRDDFSIDLGSDQSLCDPATTTLEAQHEGPGVSYKWYRNGATLPLGNQKTLYVNNSGLYKVEVSDPKCETQSDSVYIDLDLSTFEPNNIDYCMTGGPDTTLTFSVEPSGNHYNWYDVPDGGTILAGGDSTSSIDLSGIKTGDTLYVEDISLKVNPPIGPPTNNLHRNDSVDLTRTFHAESDIVLQSVQVVSGYNWGYGPCDGISNGNISAPFKVSLLKNGAIIKQSEDQQVLCGGVTSTLNLNFSIPEGTDYALHLPSGNGAWYFSDQNSEKQSFSISDVITIPEKSLNSGAFFNWVVESRNNTCARVPVMARDICVLPVELIEFFGYLNEDKVTLAWSTATENNNIFFEIQRLEGDKFVTVGKEKGAGTSKNIINYEYTDNNAPQGILYYRIKQVDYEGGSSYSSVITIDNNVFKTLLFPNPTNEFATLTVHSTSKSDILVKIYDALGVYHKSITTKAGQSIKVGQELNKGVYFILISEGGHNQQVRFVKQ